jgi:hypothetical protein
VSHPSEIRRRVIDPDGRIVVLTEHSWRHICEHAEMARFEQQVMETITHPDERRRDVRPGRERFLAQDRGPARWLRVVVDFNVDPGEVVTAFGHDNDP